MHLAISVLTNVVCTFGGYLANEAVIKARIEEPFPQGLSTLVEVTDHTLWLTLRVELGEIISYSIGRVDFVENNLLGLVDLEVERCLEPSKVQGPELLPDLLDDDKVGAALLVTWLCVEQALKIEHLLILRGFLFGDAALLLKTIDACLFLVELRLVHLASNSSYSLGMGFNWLFEWFGYFRSEEFNSVIALPSRLQRSPGFISCQVDADHVRSWRLNLRGNSTRLIVWEVEIVEHHGLLWLELMPCLCVLLTHDETWCLDYLCQCKLLCHDLDPSLFESPYWHLEPVLLAHILHDLH